MIPCKFQIDATGTGVLIYSADRMTVHAQSFDPEFVGTIAAALDIDPLEKKYAMAEISETGEISIGDEIPEQAF